MLGQCVRYRRLLRHQPALCPCAAAELWAILLMPQRSVGAPDTSELKELTQLLLSLLDTVERLPEGPERQTAINQIGSFQRRLERLFGNPIPRASGSADDPD